MSNSEPEQKGRVRTSAQTDQFDEAFAKAQAKFEAAVKANVNPAFRSKYADVSSIIDATLEHLNSEGIGVKQHPGLEYKQVGDGVEAFMVVTTRLTFKGQWEESDLSIPAVQRERFDAQSCGSALTYACRYALQGIFVVRREDDDANAATGTGSSQAAQAVGKDKVARMKANPPQQAGNRVSCLFYVESQEHKGFVDWLNIGQYVEQNEDKADALRMVFTAHGAKKRGDATLVPVDKMPSLLEKLAGDLGVDVKQLQAKD